MMLEWVRRTHRISKAVKLLRLVGMVPLSWLPAKELHATYGDLVPHNGEAQARRTHMSCNAVKVPRMGGMVPLSWLLVSELQPRNAVRLRTAQWQ